MRITPVSRKVREECIILFRDLDLYSENKKNWVFPNVFTANDTGEIVVVAPHSISPKTFAKAYHGLNTIFGRSFNGIRDLKNHRWVLLEDKLPAKVPYSSRPKDLPHGSYWLGTYSDGSPVILAFKHSPVLLVAGASGSGKSELFKVLLKEIERTWTFNAITIVEGPKDGNDFRHQRCKRLATDLQSVLEVYQELECIYEQRKQRIKELDANHWIDANAKGAGWEPHYLVIDECSMFLSAPAKGDPDYNTKVEIIRIASHLAMRGRYVGLFQIFGTQNPSATGLPSNIMDQVQLKIGYGMRTTQMSTAFFGQAAPDAEDLIEGKGIAMLGQPPQIFRGAINS